MNCLKSSLPLLMLACLLTGCSKKQADAGGSGSSDRSSSSASSTQDQPDKSAKGGAQANDIVKVPVQDQKRAGIQTAFVLVQRTPRTLSVAGQVALDEQHTSHLGTIADGRIIAVNVLPGTPVRRGQVLGSLHSHMVHETVGALVQAYAEADRQRGAVNFAKQAQGRYHHLYTPSRRLLLRSRNGPTRKFSRRKRCWSTPRQIFAWSESIFPSCCRSHLSR